MQKSTLVLLYLSVFGCITGCDFIESSSANENLAGSSSFRTIQTSYSPDKRCYFTVSESGLDSNDIDASTQILLNFKMTGSGIYAIRGIDRKLKAYWKDNSTIVIETFKAYEDDQKRTEAQSFDDKVRIEYVER